LDVGVSGAAWVAGGTPALPLWRCGLSRPKTVLHIDVT
jgi:CO/xanthine dehydrogenase FAD-binding subunit